MPTRMKLVPKIKDVWAVSWAGWIHAISVRSAASRLRSRASSLATLGTMGLSVIDEIASLDWATMVAKSIDDRTSRTRSPNAICGLPALSARTPGQSNQSCHVSRSSYSFACGLTGQVQEKRAHTIVARRAVWRVQPIETSKLVEPSTRSRPFGRSRRHQNRPHGGHNAHSDFRRPTLTTRGYPAVAA